MGSWPPPHTVRISGRARRVLLRMHPERGLEVVTPLPLSERRVAQLLDQHRDWIEQHLPRLASWPADRFPEAIDLPALGQRWPLEHVTDAVARPRLRACAEQRTLALHGPAESLWPLLGRWLTLQAKGHLLPRLDALAEHHGFRLHGASVRWSRSRWGSCSRRGTISLSARLLWLAPEEVEYVMLHELTHLEHFHHAPAFWQALETRMPGALRIDAGLRRSRDRLPAWLPLLK
ncbi:MAG TPA: M48 family peptidase [Chromatiales bacterium]|nr:M48 family peptidase [Chromatiales bacterium]